MKLSRLARWALRAVHLARRWRSCTCRSLVVAVLSLQHGDVAVVATAGADARLVAAGVGDRRAADALWNSVKVALVATVIALVLGTLAAFAMQRYRFFGRNAVSFLLVLPIALPGIVTAVALQNSFNRTIDLGLVDVPRRLRVPLARHRPRHVLRRDRLQQRRRPAAADRRRTCSRRRPTSARTAGQTFRYVTFPLVRSALRRRRHPRLRAQLRRDRRHHVHRRLRLSRRCRSGSSPTSAAPTTCPLVNVMATFVMVVSIPLAWLAQRLSDATSGPTAGRCDRGRRR